MTVSFALEKVFDIAKVDFAKIIQSTLNGCMKTSNMSDMRAFHTKLRFVGKGGAIEDSSRCTQWVNDGKNNQMNKFHEIL